MSVVEVRTEIDKLLDKVQDKNEAFLNVVHSMLSTYVQEQENPIVSYDIDGTPRTSSELTAILDAEVDAVRKGDFMTIEAFQKKSSEWAQGTK